jgi:hypothetical protein
MATLSAKWAELFTEVVTESWAGILTRFRE